MDATHAHLVLTHFPIVGSILGTLILAYGLYAKSELVIKVAVVTLFAMALITIPVFLSGEEAEETIERVTDTPHSVIHEHEELAEKAIWLMGALGILSLLTFLSIATKRSSSRILSIVTLAFSLATNGTFIQVGNLGGQIRHSEIRDANNAAPDVQLEPESDDHDHD